MAINVPIKMNGIQQLKKELKELKGLLADATDPEEIARLSAEAGRVSDSIKDVNEQVSVFASGSPFESTNNALGLMRGQLSSLDFEGASQSAKLFTANLKNITPQTIGTQLKGFTSLILDMGKGFFQVGKSLLTNPIFLLATAIIAIVGIITALLSKLGLLKPLLRVIGEFFGMIGDAIDWVVDKIKEFLDWLGLTNFAEQEAAQASADAQAKKADAYEKSAKKITGQLDQQIRLAQLEGKDTVRLELQKQYYIQQTAKERIKALQLQYKAKVMSGDYDEEEIKELKKNLEEQRKTLNESRNEAQYIRAKDKVDKKKEREEEAKQAQADAKTRNDNAKKARDEQRRRDADYKQDRINARRLLEDVETSLIKDEEARQRAEISLKYSRQIEDLIKNENLVQAEKDKLKKFYKDQEAQELAKIDAQKAEIEQEKKDEQAKLDEEAKIVYQQQRAEFDLLMKSEQEQELLAVQNKYALLLAEAKKYGDDTKAIEEQIAEETKAIQDKYALQKIESAQRERDARLTLSTEIVNGINSLGQTFIRDQKKLEKFQKTTALVQIGIDTAKAISSLVAQSQANPYNAISGGLAGAIQFASGIASILANVAKAKQILSSSGSSSAPSSGGGASPSSSASSGATAQQAQAVAPSFSLFGNSNNQNNANSSNGGFTGLQVKAIVVESDITGAQNKVNSFLKKGTL